MLLSRTLKYLGFTAIILFPAVTHGAELKFSDKTWEVNPIVNTVSGYTVRNDFELSDYIKQSYSKKPFVVSAKSLDGATVKVLEDISKTINQPAKAAKLVVENDWATEFEPGQNGQAFDLYKTNKILAAGQDTINLPVLLSKPISNLADTNDLGINELIAVGESDFTGSPYNRRVNVSMGASKNQGLILKPGEEFSFNKFLGDVDAANGFLPELVIKKSGLIAEFGGGLCQVSSTAFRAAMNAGLPITERRNHSFAVKYYAPQGTDATIYPGVVDFKFKNDLSSHLLMRTRIEGSILYYEFYGTKDDRKISFDGPTQYDKQANGAMKAIWTRNVEKDGKKIEQIFRSNYQPPALFQQATQSSTPNPASTNTTPAPNQTTTPEPTPTPPTT